MHIVLDILAYLSGQQEELGPQPHVTGTPCQNQIYHDPAKLNTGLKP